uniref:C2H2-type domain-containing protein n=1 Tax=Magallana gigas TaxID=29159 RepID=K1RWU2_MAGGI
MYGFRLNYIAQFNNDCVYSDFQYILSTVPVYISVIIFFKDDGNICEVCGKMFSSKQGMQEHKISEHTKEYKFKCGQCEKDFLSRTRFKSHLLLHLNEKPFACNKCTKAYVHKKDLQKHKLVQHDEGEKFKCDDCNSFFSYKSTLKRHIEAKHKKDNIFMLPLQFMHHV